MIINPALPLLVLITIPSSKLKSEPVPTRIAAPSTNVSGRDSQTMSVPFTARLDPSDANMMLLTYVSAATDINVDMDA